MPSSFNISLMMHKTWPNSTACWIHLWISNLIVITKIIPWEYPRTIWVFVPWSFKVLKGLTEDLVWGKYLENRKFFFFTKSHVSLVLTLFWLILADAAWIVLRQLTCECFVYTSTVANCKNRNCVFHTWWEWSIQASTSHMVGSQLIKRLKGLKKTLQQWF